MFEWLRRREGKRTVVESAKPEPVDPIDELVSLIGETEPDPRPNASGAERRSRGNNRNRRGSC
jgi:hypothetical protein